MAVSVADLQVISARAARAGLILRWLESLPALRYLVAQAAWRHATDAVSSRASPGPVPGQRPAHRLGRGLDLRGQCRATCSGSYLLSRCTSIVYPVERSTRVPIAVRLGLPMIRSPSQCPGTPVDGFGRPLADVDRRAFLVAVRVDQRGVDADHDHVAEIPVAGARRRDRTVARLDQLPHPPANLVTHQRDPGQTRVVDLERPPQCRCGATGPNNLA